MANMDVNLKVGVEGVGDATRQLADLGKSLADTIAALNTGGAASSKASTPALAPPAAPPLDNGVGAYAVPGINEGAANLFPTASGLLRPGYIPSANPAPPPAPDPHGTGYSFPLSGGVSNGMSTVGGGPIDVRVVASTIPMGGGSGSGSGDGSGGGGGNSGGGSGGGSGNGGGSSTPSSGPGNGPASGGGSGNPFVPGSFNPFSQAGGGSFASIMQQVMANPTIGGVSRALLNAIPAVPSAIYGGAMETARYGLDVYQASTQPRFQTDLSILTTQASGTYINPLLADAQRRAADTRGEMAGEQAALAPLNAVTFGVADRVYNLTVGRDLTEAASLQEAQGTDDLLRQRMGALGQTVVPKSTADTRGADLQKQAAGLKTDLFGRALGLASNPLDAFQAGLDIYGLWKNGHAVKQNTQEIAQDTALDSDTYKLKLGAAAFGPDAVRGVDKDFIKRYTNERWDSDQVTDAGGTLMSYALRPGNADLAAPIIAGKGLDTDLKSVLDRMVGQGDLSDLLHLPAVVKNAQEFKEAMSAAFAQATLLTTTIPIAVAHVALTQANTSYDAATGAGYRTISADTTATATATELQIGLERQALAKMTNPLDVANQKAKIRGLQAQEAQETQQAALTVFQGRDTDNQAFTTYASNVMLRAQTGGSEADVNRAFGLEADADRRDYRLLLDRSNSPVISPEQRKLLRQQAEAKRLEASLTVPQARSAYDYSITQAKIGVGAATADAAALNAQMYGGYEEQQVAQVAQANVTGARLSAVTARLADPDAHLSAGDRLQLSQEQIRLTADFANALETATRSALSLHVATDQMKADFVATGNTVRMSYFGAGGAAAGALQSTDIAANRVTLTSAQDNFAHYDALVKSGKMSPNSRAYLDAKAGVQQAQGTLYGSEDALSSLPFSLADRTAKMDADFAIQVSSRGILPMGNMRGNIQRGMDAVGAELRDLGRNEARELAEAGKDTYATEKDRQDRLDAIRYNFKTQQYGLDGQLVDYQSQLQAGWQDRLISSVVNMPARASFVSSAFTKAEAAHYINAMGDLDNGSMGSNSVTARDNTMFRYPRLLATSIGQTNHASGFLDTAVAEAGGMAPMGGMPPPAGGVLRPGSSSKIEITINNDNTATVKQGGRTTTLKPGSSATVIHDISNGALTLGGGSAHAKGTSHQ